MHRAARTAILMTTVAIAGCSPRQEQPAPNGIQSSDDHLAHLIAEGRFGTAPRVLGPEAERLARESYSSPEERSNFVYYYYDAYESALKKPGSVMQVGLDLNDASNHGVRAGRAAALADQQTAAPRLTLQDFGYTPVDVQGRLHIQFERSELLPDGSPQRWWVDLGPEAGQVFDRALGGEPEEIAYFEVHVIGLLAPDRGFGVGHMNGYAREVVVTKIAAIKRVAAPVSSSGRSN